MNAALSFSIASSNPCRTRDAFNYAQIYVPRYNFEPFPLGREIPDLDDLPNLYDLFQTVLKRRRQGAGQDMAVVVLQQLCPSLRHVGPPVGQAVPRVERHQTFVFTTADAPMYHKFKLGVVNERGLAAATLTESGAVLPNVIVPQLPPVEAGLYPPHSLVPVGFEPQLSIATGYHAALTGRERIVTPDMLAVAQTG